MRRWLLRTAIITGGCAAGILITLANTSPAQADNIGDTIHTIAEDVLPQPTPDREQPAPQAADVVEDLLGTVVDVVVDLVDVLPPADSAEEPPTPDAPTSAPNITPQPNEPAAPARDARPTPTRPTATAAVVPNPSQTDHISPTRGDSRHPNPHHTATTPPPAPVADSPPANPDDWPQPPSDQPTPGQDATGSSIPAHPPTIGLDLPATITARATHPHTTAIRIPGHNQAATSRTSRPDAPSG